MRTANVMNCHSPQKIIHFGLSGDDVVRKNGFHKDHSLGGWKPLSSKAESAAGAAAAKGETSSMI